MSTPVNTADFMKEFESFHDCFVIIGGTPTVMYLEDREGESPRATKDLDIVVIDIAPDGRWKEFLEKLRSYVKAHQYECKNLKSGKSQAYRYDNPKSSLAPKILEISTRRADQIPDEQPAQRLQEFEMSAIVCEPYFVDLLSKYAIKMKIGVTELPIPNVGLLITMKAFAILNLEKSEDPDKQNKVHKHAKDIARLARVLTGEDKITLPEIAHNHLVVLLNRKEDFFSAERMKGCGWKDKDSARVMQNLLLEHITKE